MPRLICSVGRTARLPQLALAFLLSFSPALTAQQTVNDPDRVPPALDHGWPVASPSSVGLDPPALDALARRIAEGQHGQIDAFLVIRNGKLVFERYFGGYNPYTLHTLQSATKSVTSTLIGIAIDRGAIASVDKPIRDFFPEHRHLFDADSVKAAITLQHLLTMRMGQDWPESGVAYSGTNIVWALENAYDWMGFALERPMAARPGSVFNYSSAASLLLSGIIQNATGLKANVFAERYLFDPLGIPNYAWWRNMEHPDRWAHTGGGLHLMPRDFAKIGYLLINGGKWHEKQIVSPAWIEAATKARIKTVRSAVESYGYQWWLRPIKKEGGPGTGSNDIVHAAGWGGQHMFVVPSLDMVVVFVSSNFTDRARDRGPVDMLYDVIIPAVRRRPQE
ncbi:MAG: serine hydrolase domain-containing protein [Gammaproteobacteria bacterium]